MADRFEDERGVIQDLLGPVDAVTEIITRKGGVRGNHVHKATIQWTYVTSGLLRVVTVEPVRGRREAQYGPGGLVTDLPGVPHAWEALEDTRVLVFTRGPRSGEGYESDTERLTEKLI